MKSATLFSGGEGAGLGMVAAGFEHAWGVEYDDKIAQVARDNGFNVLTADILQCDPNDFDRVDWLHASPPCPNFSNAKANAEETDNDRALAAKVCQFITELLPRFVTLENVYQYRKSQSWQTIAKTLLTHGYALNYWHVNMADYGVPQTRKRMIVIARRDGITPMLPPATHAEIPVNGFFEKRKQWVGWYEAIEDLIPTLPDSEFAPWQLERLPDEFRYSLLAIPAVGNGKQHRISNEPAATVVAKPFGDGNKAFIAPGGNATSFSIRNGDEPARVVGDVGRVGNMARAFVMDAANPHSNGQIKHRWEDEPVKTMTASDMTIKAFIDGQQTAPDGNGGRKLTIRNEEPAVTISASNHKSPHMAITNGRVVKMTPRALARFQAFPDWYTLPEKNALACRIIGNAVPPLFMQRLGEGLV